MTVQIAVSCQICSQASSTGRWSVEILQIAHRRSRGLGDDPAAHERERLQARYREALMRVPETPGELADAGRLAIESIEEEPWERWW